MIEKSQENVLDACFDSKEVYDFSHWLDEKSLESCKEKILSYRLVSFYHNKFQNDFEKSIKNFIEISNRSIPEIINGLTLYSKSYEEKFKKWTNFFYENYACIMQNVCEESERPENVRKELAKYIGFNRIRVMVTLEDLRKSARCISEDSLFYPKNDLNENTFKFKTKDMSTIALHLTAIAISNACKKFKEETQK